MFSSPASGSSQPNQSQTGNEGPASPTPAPDDSGNKSTSKTARIAKLKAAVRDYGSLVVVFHVGISLVSLGFIYTLVARLDDELSCWTSSR